MKISGAVLLLCLMIMPVVAQSDEKGFTRLLTARPSMAGNWFTGMAPAIS
ncbi:MAG: hypothetical protein IPG76_18045 [Acidobacteria bacterium]|nr:hypothetical protein [Acidobacteriota bacterium]